MEYQRHGRTMVPVGNIFEEVNSAIEFARQLEEQVLVRPLNQLKFIINEEGILKILLEDTEYFVTYPALKDLCKLLKLPVSFINKFPISGLTLENLNNNPFLIDEQRGIQLILWKWEENYIIAGFLLIETGFIPIAEYLQIMRDEGAFEKEEAKPESIVISGEEVVSYFMMPEAINRDGFSFHPGYSIHYVPTHNADTTVHPFYKMAFTNDVGEMFDFDFESKKRLHVAKRKRKDFTDITLELSTEYSGEDLGFDLDTNVKRGIAAKQLDSIKFSLLKMFKSRATSVYGYNGMKISAGAVVEEVIPEYKNFMEAHREQLKTKEAYETNTMLVDFYLPVFCNRLFTFRSSFENPYYYIRYRKTIGNIFDKILEEVGDIILE